MLCGPPQTGPLGACVIHPLKLPPVLVLHGLPSPLQAQLPLDLGASLTLRCLGHITPRPGFHSQSAIYPVGIAPSGRRMKPSQSGAGWEDSGDGGDGEHCSLSPSVLSRTQRRQCNSCLQRARERVCWQEMSTATATASEGDEDMPSTRMTAAPLPADGWYTEGDPLALTPWASQMTLAACLDTSALTSALTRPHC